MPGTRKLPPIWLLGFTNATFGMYAGFSVVTLPLMLAALGIPGGRIAAITAAVLSPGFWIFLVAPILDVRFSRRAYALAFSGIAASCMTLAVWHRHNARFIETALFLGYIAASLVQGAVGGWVGSLVESQHGGSPPSGVAVGHQSPRRSFLRRKSQANDPLAADKKQERTSRLGAWFTVSNIGSGGLMMIIAGECITKLPSLVAGCLLGSILLLPSLLYLAIPAPPPDRQLARESFSRFAQQLLLLVKRQEVLVALALFALPSASFTLTNVLGGIGHDFSAGERLVSLLAGSGAAIAGVAGSLLLPPLARRLPLRPLYLAVGALGAVFTIALLLLPRTPTTFAIAITGENIFQALAFSTSSAITFEVVGADNPLAATLFSFLLAATNFPIIYMGFVDGHAYSWRGVKGSFLVDAGLSLAMCLLLGLGLYLAHKRVQSERLSVVGR